MSERLGAWDSQTFLVDMNKLFEVFVTEILRTRAKGELTVSEQVELTLAENGRIPIRPDILIGRCGATLLVADCKYKRFQSESVNNQDYYQVLSYCIATRAQRGLIVYPRQEMFLEQEFRIRNTNIQIEQCTIDCGLGVDAIEAECDRFAAYIFSLAAEPVLS